MRYNTVSVSYRKAVSMFVKAEKILELNETKKCVSMSAQDHPEWSEKTVDM